MGLYNKSHAPEGLENNWLFRKAFLIRKLFFSKRKFSHYGQMAEDVAFARFLKDKKKGVYVDVGCFHPIKYNNTYRLYKRKWTGVNIDIDRIKIEGFDWLRPKDTNIAMAVSNQKGEVTYYSNGFYSLTVTLDHDFAKNTKYKYVPKTIQADTLTNILDTTKYKDQVIDFLNIDTEGHDMAVLQSLNFERYRPQLIVVECIKNSIEEVLTDPIYLFLSSKGYRLVNWVGLTLYFQI